MTAPQAPMKSSKAPRRFGWVVWVLVGAVIGGTNGFFAPGLYVPGPVRFVDDPNTPLGGDPNQEVTAYIKIFGFEVYQESGPYGIVSRNAKSRQEEIGWLTMGAGIILGVVVALSLRQFLLWLLQ